MPSLALMALRLFIKEAQDHNDQNGIPWFEMVSAQEVEDWALGQAEYLLSDNSLDSVVKAG